MSDDAANKTNQSFDACLSRPFFRAGNARNPADWTTSNLPNLPNWLYRGYTGHEHLKEFALINMNGRMYDPVLARFLSPDKLLQNSSNTQNYNGYSYVLNNPLKYTDPSGWAYEGYTVPFARPYSPTPTTHQPYDEWNPIRGGYTLNGVPISNERAMTLLRPQADKSGSKYDVTSDSQVSFDYYRDSKGHIYGNKQGALRAVLKNNGWDEKSAVFKQIATMGNNSSTSLVWRNESGYHSIEISFSSSTFNAKGNHGEIAQGSGGGNSSDVFWNNVNTGIGAFDVGQGAKGELIRYAAKSSPAINDLKYVKGMKVLGGVTFGVSSAISVGLAGNYYVNGGTNSSVGIKASLDIIMGGVGFLGPIGFGVSATYFLLDAGGAFGGYGDPLLTPKR